MKYLEHVARLPILAHDEVTRTEVGDRPARFGDDGYERGLLHDIRLRRRSRTGEHRDRDKSCAE